LALTRESLYVEMVSALALPHAPIATEDATDTEDEVKKPLSVTPSSLVTMSAKMARAFPAEKGMIKAFLANNLAYGEKRGQVVWQGGVGRMRGGEGGFRGKVDTDGLCHVFVDQ
jgi:hypothetical protein